MGEKKKNENKEEEKQKEAGEERGGSFGGEGEEEVGQERRNILYVLAIRLFSWWIILS